MLHATRILHAKLISLMITSAHPLLESFCGTKLEPYYCTKIDIQRTNIHLKILKTFNIDTSAVSVVFHDSLVFKPST